MREFKFRAWDKDLRNDNNFVNKQELKDLLEKKLKTIYMPATVGEHVNMVVEKVNEIINWINNADTPKCGGVRHFPLNVSDFDFVNKQELKEILSKKLSNVYMPKTVATQIKYVIDEVFL